MMFNPWVIVCALLALAASGGFGFKLGTEHELAKQVEAIRQAEQARVAKEEEINTVSKGYEQVVAYQNTQIKQAQKGWRDALNNPKYIGCDIGAVGVQYLNQRINEANHPGQPGATVSGNPTPAASGNDVRSDAGTLGLGVRLRNLFGAAQGFSGGR